MGLTLANGFRLHVIRRMQRIYAAGIRNLSIIDTGLGLHPGVISPPQWSSRRNGPALDTPKLINS